MDAIRSQLAARVAELEGQRDRLREALEWLIDASEFMREEYSDMDGAVEQARAALKATEEG